ncbi:hypothetical protein RFI_23866, partial [Reticulomyxa filosa]
DQEEFRQYKQQAGVGVSFTDRAKTQQEKYFDLFFAKRSDEEDAYQTHMETFEQKIRRQNNLDYEKWKARLNAKMQAFRESNGLDDSSRLNMTHTNINAHLTHKPVRPVADNKKDVNSHGHETIQDQAQNKSSNSNEHSDPSQKKTHPFQVHRSPGQPDLSPKVSPETMQATTTQTQTQTQENIQKWRSERPYEHVYPNPKNNVFLAITESNSNKKSIHPLQSSNGLDRQVIDFFNKSPKIEWSPHVGYSIVLTQLAIATLIISFFFKKKKIVIRQSKILIFFKFVQGLAFTLNKLSQIQKNNPKKKNCTLKKKQQKAKQKF